MTTTVPSAPTPAADTSARDSTRSVFATAAAPASPGDATSDSPADATPAAAAPSAAAAPIASRADALAADAADPLAPLRELFRLPPGRLYLDGNSLGALPRATAGRLREAVEQEWGDGLIASWNDAGWITLPQRVGDKIARLVGAGAGEVVAADSTSVNLYKVLSAALAIARDGAPQRRRIVSERSNFPTDLYIAASLAAAHGCELVLADTPEALAPLLDARTAVLMLTHVNYRTGRLHDMAALSRAAHDAGALAVWDLAHSAGAVPLALAADGADFAVGCGYKYLNGGPGAPAFVWVHPAHAERFEQPLAGWMGHAAPFEFTPGYRPAPGVARYLCGTPALLSMAALDCGVDTVLAAEPLGGVAALRAKSLALTRLFAAQVRAGCPALALVSPERDAERGSQVCFAHAEIGWPAMRALAARGVVGDFRAPDVLRFGFTPLYVGYADAWDAAAQLCDVVASGAWRDPAFAAPRAVT